MNDINDIKFIALLLKISALADHNVDIANFADKVIYLAERYQDNCHDNKWHDKHERKAYSFLMKFAERLRDKDISHGCKSAFFENEFLELLDDYPSLKQRFKERIRGDMH